MDIKEREKDRKKKRGRDYKAKLTQRKYTCLHYSGRAPSCVVIYIYFFIDGEIKHNLLELLLQLTNA